MKCKESYVHPVAPQVKLVIKRERYHLCLMELIVLFIIFPLTKSVTAHLVTCDVISFLSFIRRKS